MSAYYYAVKDEELIDLGWTKPEVAKLRTAEKAIYAKRMEADKAERLVSELIAKKQREEIATRYSRLGLAGRKAYAQARKLPSPLHHYENELSCIALAERADQARVFDGSAMMGPFAWLKFWKK